MAILSKPGIIGNAAVAIRGRATRRSYCHPPPHTHTPFLRRKEEEEKNEGEEKLSPTWFHG